MTLDEAYKILGVSYEDSEDIIKKKYKEMVKKNHPDLGGDEKKFKSIKEAYETIQKRKLVRKKLYKISHISVTKFKVEG